ncbi:serine hydrolase domain-containing protein [Robiginitalea aurantiaca]|uniref:Serine hydrolase n=1 Tax=Robiginitalea aurantiaca TaxID=3056915 RepID=A0ABT7WGI2_9FLAO|nr:serine hydrolase [Robiginitalea aurantiaca]MDM9632025.1 serine hydrolase [Robiginitalea aurantiaca]
MKWASTFISKSSFKIIGSFLLVFILATCTKSETESETDPENTPDQSQDLYYPPISASKAWETVSLESLNWDTAAATDLNAFLEAEGTQSFLILKDGKIAMESYFGTTTKESLWYWASAGKTLTSFLIGIAAAEGKLSVDDRTSDHLGQGWTSALAEKEQKIRIIDQLRMTSGLDENIFECTTPNCLQFTADAGTRWAYHNGPYTMLQSVISNAVSEDFNTYFNSRLRNRIGMDGFWLAQGQGNNVYYSSARAMARFGLLILGQGKWDSEPVLTDMNYYRDMLRPSQSFNQAYGYLWWLNGQDRFMAPGSQVVFPGELIPSAPGDLVAGLGKNDQKLYIVPSQNLVIVRMGNDTGDALLGPSSFDSALWERISDMIGL